MSSLRILSRAQRDLADIRDRIGRENPPRAVSFIVELIDHFSRLAERPLIGRARPEMGSGIRSMPHGRYVIFYRPNKTGISIYRVIHGSRDLRRGLQ